MNVRPGLVLAAVSLCFFGLVALTVDLPRVEKGFQSDEATYYMIGQSLVHDWDLTYRKADLVRVWREFPAGPAGVFLKRGHTLDGHLDRDPGRMYYGKSFIYPLVAAPFVALAGTNGFLILNALMLALVLLCGYLFLHARAPAAPSAVLAASFVMASVVPVYFVQIMPEVFNFSLGFVAYFCWLYKEVAAPERSPRGTAWLFTPRSDLACAALLGVATFSKPTNALLFAAPVLYWLLFRRGAVGVATARSRWKTTVQAVVIFMLLAGGLFAVNKATSGEWNYQGGERKSYYFEFPFQTEVPQHPLGVDKAREAVLGNIIFNPRTFTSNFAHNVVYFFAGRHTGMLGYCFPGAFALIAFLASPRRRPSWQWLVLGAAALQGLIFLIATPYTWSGGGVGNRYFLNGYSVMLFLLPPLESLALAFVPWVIGAVFVAPMVFQPFIAAHQPADNAKSGPLRIFPIELTLINDLPVNNDPEHARIWLGDNPGRNDPGFLVYFLDDNTYGREGADKSFWTRGDSRAEFVIKADKPIRRATFELLAGPVPADVTVAIDGRRQSVHLDPGQATSVALPMPAGVRYEKEVQGVLAWTASVTTSGGFTPVFYGSSDARFLGVRVRPMLEARPQP